MTLELDTVYGAKVSELKAERDPATGDSALYSLDERYRYLLVRNVDPGNDRSLLWVMLNPSTATAFANDNTIRRVVGFTEREGYGRALICNLFAYRSHNPKRLLEQDDPVGKWNHTIIRNVCREAQDAVFAWSDWPAILGKKGVARPNVERLAYDAGLTPKCLGYTKSGNPRHPLYLKRETPLEMHVGPLLRSIAKAKGEPYPDGLL